MTEATVPATPAAAPKPVKIPLKETFDNEAALITEVNGREKGPRRAFKVEVNSKTFWVAANNEGRAAGVAAIAVGAKVTEVGKVAKVKNLDTDTLLTALATLSPEDRAKVQEQLKALASAKK